MSGVRQAQVPTGEVTGSPDWLACLHEMCDLLWPPPTVVTLDNRKPAQMGLAGSRWRPGSGPATSPDGREFALIAGVRRPPLMVPAERRLAAAAVRQHSRPRSAVSRMAVRALCLGLSAGMGGTALRWALRGRVQVATPAGADAIDEYLKTVLSRDLTVGMFLGPARANRKPVLQLLAPSREPAGFAKIGVNPLTRSLVRAEHEALVRLNRVQLAQVAVPQVLHYDTWRGLEVLVLSALPAWLPPRRLRPPRLVAAMTEVAGVAGLRQQPLAASDYPGRLRARLAATDHTPERAALMQALGVVAARAGQQTLTLGAWHGDWSPWNMASTGDGLLVWDWERFATGVPLGFDALHHQLQAEVVGTRSDPQAAALRCLEHAPRDLAPFGLSPDQARLTAVLYLTELATRYLADRQAQAGAPLGSPRTWLIPAISQAAARL